MSERRVDSVCIIGTGLIGGSLALAIKRAGFCSEVIGAGRTEETLIRAVELGVIDRYETSMSKAAEAADIVVVCVPLGANTAASIPVICAASSSSALTVGSSP